MREILFRGKRVDNGEWVEGHNIILTEQGKGRAFIIPTGEYIYSFETKTGRLVLETPQIEVVPETVGQYTGLTDKNGTKIFEGDIIQFDYAGKGKGVNGVEAVVFENGKFGVKWGYHKHLVCLDGFANTTLEVIGNIHDNPELLKGEN